MKITITEQAKTKLGEVFKESNYKDPALRIIFAGAG